MAIKLTLANLSQMPVAGVTTNCECWSTASQENSIEVGAHWI